jgi:osmoprotectant transport system permease protein
MDTTPKERDMIVVAQAAVRRDIGVFEWLFDPESWTGRGGILGSLWDTVVLCSVVVAVAIVVTVPLAAWLAHYRRGELSVAWVVTLSRAVPTFAVAGVLVPISLRSGFGFEPWPIFIALLLLALPPIFLNTYTAIRGVDPGAVDAARAMGYSEMEILFKVELALATTVIFAGIRIAAVAVVATEPIRAFLGGHGLGRYVRDGLGQNNHGLVIAGAILVAGLAGLTTAIFRVAENVVLPDGVRRLSRAVPR